MATVLLYGHLAREFGKRHEFDISSPGEAVRAMKANYPGFEKAVLGHTSGYHVLVGFEDRVGASIGDVMSQREVIRIVPSVTGAGIVEGIAAIFVYLGASAAAATFIAGIIVNVAISLAISSIANALFAPDKADPGGSERAENKPSYLFNGPVNTMAQGHPVAVGYGRLLIGSQVVSAGLTVEQIHIEPPPPPPPLIPIEEYNPPA